MKKRIMFGMCLIAFIAVMLTSVFSILIMYEDIKEKTLNDIEGEAYYVKEVYENTDMELVLALEEIIDGRILIFDDSEEINVIYDSINKGNEVDQEYRSEELAIARENGIYLTSRYSQSTWSNTYYCYVLADNGDIIRISEEIVTVYDELLSFAPWMALIIVFVCLFSIMISKIQTNRIVEPINKLNFNNVEPNSCYEELYPLLRKIDRQKREITKNVQLLENRQKEFEIIIRNMSEGFIVIDINGDVLTFNDSALHLCGYINNFSIGDSVFKINRDTDFYNVINKALSGESLEHEQKINGRHCKFLLGPVEMYDEICGVTIVIMDTTEIENREEMRREFTANVSHELKTPLTSISGYSEIIKTGIAKEEDVKRFAEKIYDETQRLIELVADIIKLSRLDESNGILKKEICDIYEIAKKATARLNLTAEKAEVNLVLVGKSVRIMGVSNLLEEMIYNLCDNAIKYNVPNGDVKVNVERFVDKAIITVEDTGVGIPAKDRDRIFERFYRVDKSHSKIITGTGLGLSIVKHCVKLHSGTINLNSEEGKGTKIVIEL